MDDLRPTMPDDLRTRIGKTLHRLYGPILGAHPDGWEREPVGTQEMYLEDADAVIRELPELQFPQRFMLSIASQDAEGRRLDAASWLEKELTSAGLECGAGWVLYNLVDGVIARLNRVAE